MPEFQSRQIVGTQILVESLPCNSTYGIWESGNYLCVVYYDSATETLVHLFDKQLGESRGDYIHRGRGPLEIPPTIPSVHERNGNIYLSDLHSGKTLSFNIKRLAFEGSSAITSDYEEYKNYISIASTLPNGEKILLNNIGFVNPDTLNYHRLEIQDANGITKSYGGAVPYADSKMLFYLYQQSVMEVSPNCQHMVLGSVWGGLLELYSLPDFADAKLLRLVDPAISIDRGMELTSKTTSGLRDLVAKDNGFYAVLGSDVYVLENLEKPEKERELANNDIYFFNWRGKPLKQFETNYNLEKICITESQDTLYSVVSDVNGQLSIGMTVLN